MDGVWNLGRVWGILLPVRRKGITQNRAYPQDKQSQKAQQLKDAGKTALICRRPVCLLFLFLLFCL
jgi:F420-0:gamma-glutamyl ligase-like protein